MLGSCRFFEAFIHASVVQQCGLHVEDIIAFDVHVSKDGNPQASYGRG